MYGTLGVCDSGVSKGPRGIAVAALFLCERISRRSRLWLTRSGQMEEQQEGGSIEQVQMSPGHSQPDRADACIWALSELLAPRAEPRVMGL
jgi:phage terminase large subunit-like protein